MRCTTFATAAMAGWLALIGAGHAATSPNPAMPQVIAPLNPTMVPTLSDAARPTAAPMDSAAPMPDQDANAPAGVAVSETQLVPTVYVDKAHYVGDGYAAGSNDHQRTLQPAAGLALDVPLN